MESGKEEMKNEEQKYKCILMCKGILVFLFDFIIFAKKFIIQVNV